jgi:hypothetical protein
MRYASDLTDSLITRQISELMHLGAPVDVFYIEDLPRLVEQGLADRYRVAFFLDCIEIPQPLRSTLRKAFCGGDRSLIWQYAAGLAQPDGLSAEAMSELIGIPVALRNEPTPLRVACSYTGSVIQYGAEHSLQPVLAGRADQLDPDEIHGHYLKPDLPALVVREQDGWRSVWSGAPAMPALLLRRLCAEAGVHIYTDGGDQVLAVNDLLAVHAAFDGPRTISLPAPAGVTDAMTGNPVVREFRDEITVTLQRGDTALWRLEE